MEQKVQQLEIDMAELKKDICYIKNSLDKNDDQHKEIIDKIDLFVQSSVDRFAEKKYHQESMKRIGDIITTLDCKYVKVEEFKPIRIIIYGMVGFILIAFLTAIVGLVIIK